MTSTANGDKDNLIQDQNEEVIGFGIQYVYKYVPKKDPNENFSQEKKLF